MTSWLKHAQKIKSKFLSLAKKLSKLSELSFCSEFWIQKKQLCVCYVSCQGQSRIEVTESLWIITIKGPVVPVNPFNFSLSAKSFQNVFQGLCFEKHGIYLFSKCLLVNSLLACKYWISTRGSKCSKRKISCTGIKDIKQCL